MRTALLAFCFLSCSCSMRPLYAPLGGALGAAAGGAVGGPGGAFLGGGAGAATGSLLAGDGELQEAKDTITAISKGDVEALVAAGMGKQKGFMDEALDAVYGLIKLVCIGLILWNVVPIIYTRYVHKRANGSHKKITS